MRSLITAKAIELLTPLFILYSLYLLFRGHNDPGGGFIGGLIGAIPFVFSALIHGVQATKKKYHLNTIRLMAAGLLTTASSTLISVFTGKPYLTTVWSDFYLPIIGSPSTPMMFDIGVYMLVMGMVLKTTFTMAEQ